MDARIRPARLTVVAVTLPPKLLQEVFECETAREAGRFVRMETAPFNDDSHGAAPANDVPAP